MRFLDAGTSICIEIVCVNTMRRALGTPLASQMRMLKEQRIDLLWREEEWVVQMSKWKLLPGGLSMHRRLARHPIWVLVIVGELSGRFGLQLFPSVRIDWLISETTVEHERRFRFKGGVE